MEAKEETFMDRCHELRGFPGSLPRRTLSLSPSKRPVSTGRTTYTRAQPSG